MQYKHTSCKLPPDLSDDKAELLAQKVSNYLLIADDEAFR